MRHERFWWPSVKSLAGANQATEQGIWGLLLLQALAALRTGLSKYHLLVLATVTTIPVVSLALVNGVRGALAYRRLGVTLKGALEEGVRELWALTVMWVGIAYFLSFVGAAILLFLVAVTKQIESVAKYGTARLRGGVESCGSAMPWSALALDARVLNSGKATAANA
jgi:hypothetical protein